MPRIQGAQGTYDSHPAFWLALSLVLWTRSRRSGRRIIAAGPFRGEIMIQYQNRVVTAALAALTAVVALAGSAGAAGDPNLQPFADPSGYARTFSTSGFIDTANPFFQDLGSNGRSCVTCHQPSDGWTITPAHLQARFDATGGLDPVFRTNDGANSPRLDYSTVAARRSACSMLLNKGLIRVGIGIPDNAEFTLVACDDPYGYASAKELSLFRRPLPATNLGYLSGVMWDGRQTFPGNTMAQNLMSQSNDATLGHAQALHGLTDEQKQQIVTFESSLGTAQMVDNQAGPLNIEGAFGGPGLLELQPFFLGINDPLGLNPTHAPFNPHGFTLFQGWSFVNSGLTSVDEARLSIARGEEIFNTRPININGVSGLNDELKVDTIRGTCTTCHDTPNVGDHSVAAPLNIGLTDALRRTADLPLYTLENKQTGQMVQTTDPGRALITGKWKDIGRFKGPILRGLAARAPYFHNGSAATLNDVVKFYDDRFELKLTPREKADLVAFLRCL